MLYTRPLVTPLTRPLTGKVLKQFDPLSNDPYLLFDAETSMLGELESPTLDLDASDPETLEVITATRSGVATFTDQAGVIQEAEPNTVRVDHVQGEELTPTKYQRVGYTDFDNSSQWYSYQVSIAAGQVSPIGDNSAFKITSTGTDPYVYSPIETSVGTNTFSFYCKGEGDSVGGTARVLFWHISGVSTATGTQESIDFTLTDEWQRFEFQHTLTGAGTLYYRIDVPANTSTAGHVAYLWGPQLEEGTTATDFVPNTTGSPKFIASATYGPRVPMMLIEPSATNLVPYSEDFTQSSWVKNDVDVSAAPVAAPDGTMTAAHVSVTGSNPHLVDLDVVQANTHTVSIWARTVSGSGTCYFNANSTGAVQTVTDQWQRFEVPANNIHAYAVDFRGSSTLTEIYIWGAQAELGSVATSYIPTSGSAVTRNADNLQITGSNFTDFYNTSEFTVYVEAVPRTSSGVPHYYSISDGTNSNRTGIYLSGSTVSHCYSGGVSQVGLSMGAFQLNTLNRAAVSYRENNIRGSANGSSEAVATSGLMPVGVYKMTLGARYNNANYLNGHLKRLIFWPTHSDSL